MKKYINIAFAFAFAFALASCSDSSSPDPLAIQAELLSGSASLADNGAVAPEGATPLDWSALEVTITGDAMGGTITASGVPAGGEPVWPASSTWTFSDTAGSKMLRADGVEMTVVAASESSLALSFPVTQPSARIKIIGGSWSFTFDK